MPKRRKVDSAAMAEEEGGQQTGRKFCELKTEPVGEQFTFRVVSIDGGKTLDAEFPMTR